MKIKILAAAALLALFVQGMSFAKGIIEERTAADYDKMAEQVDAFIEAGDYAAAIPLLKRMHELKPEELYPIESLGIFYFNLPEKRPALTNVLFWLTEAEKRGSSNDYVYYNLACLYSLKGNVEKAEASINKAFALGYSYLNWINNDDDLVNFRNGFLWKSIEDNYTLIEEQLYLFNEFASIEDEESITDRITFYNGIITNLKKLSPHIPALQCNPLDYLGSSYYDMRDYAKAEPCFLEAKTIREQALGKNHLHYASSLNDLGYLYSVMGDYAKAIPYYLEAKSIYEQALGKNHPDYATSLNDLGYMYSKMGDYAKAESYHLEAKNIREQVLGKNHPSYATSLNNLGSLYQNMGDYAKAEPCFLEAKTIREQVLGKNHPSYATSLNNLGSLYQDMGDYAKAESYYLEAKKIDEQALGKNHPDYATSLNNLGSLYKDIGDYTEAEQYYLEAKAIREQSLGKNHPDYGASLNNLGFLYHFMGDYANAEQYYLEAKAISEQVFGKNHPDYAISLNNMGGLYQNMGDYAKAESYYLEAKAVWEQTLGKNHPDYASSLNNLGLFYSDIEDYVKTEAYNIELCELRINLINQNFSFMSEQQRSSYLKTVSGGFEASYSLSRLYPVESVNGQNYTNTLFTKGLLLRTTNAIRDAIYSSGDAALIAQFEQLGGLRRQISALQQKEDANEAYLQSLEEQADALDKALTAASSAFRDLKADMAMQWQEVRDSLQPDEAAIEFVSFQVYDKKWTGIVHYAALVLKAGSTAPVWVPLFNEGELQEILGRAGGRRSSDQAHILYTIFGQELFNTVWKPLEQELTGVKTIYYSPSGLLHKIAFNALPADNSANERLIDKYNLNLVSSTREIVHLNRSSAETTQITSAVLYGGLDYNADENKMRTAASSYKNGAGVPAIAFVLPAGVTRGGMWNVLPATREEALNIRGYLAGKKIPTTLYMDSLGNEESFKQLDGAKTGLIHLATHGFFLADVERKHDDREQTRSTVRAAENPLLRSGLLLAGGNHAWTNNPVEGVEDGVLYADEITGINLLGAKLVVMSACQTGLGDVNNGEGVFGLQRAFKLAGVETLIMSLWEVDDAATAKLMSVFYQEWLFSGKAKQEAFKEAQHQVRAEYPEPFYWAAFVMMD
jgi:CHAT domain-containing protein/Flp pilus assembly protein TadD